MKSGRKYGPVTAVAMVVGSVIGSGVFFKTETLINITKGDGILSLAAWIAGGVCMAFCLLSFVCVVRETNEADCLIKIAENTVGKGYGYYLGWFMVTVYYPSLAGVLSWLTARYTLLAFSAEASGSGLCMLLSCMYLILSFSQNALSPRISGKVQVVSTALKLIPLVLMIVFGIREGILSGVMKENLSMHPCGKSDGGTFFAAVSAVLFAYEGWIAGLSIGKELKNSKKNLPVSLITGGAVVTAVYILYYLGIMGSVPSGVLMESGTDGIKFAFSSVFGKLFSDCLLIFVAISCFGALNGMMFSAGRTMMELKGNFSGTDSRQDAFITELVLSSLWLFLFFGISVSGKPLFGGFGFDVSEIPVITVYSVYIPIFFIFLKKKNRSLKTKITVSMGIFASAAMVICAFIAHKDDVADYFLILSGIMLMGKAFRKK